MSIPPLVDHEQLERLAGLTREKVLAKLNSKDEEVHAA